MNLLRELVSKLEQPRELAEAKRSMSQLIEEWMDAKQYHSFEGASGPRQFDELTKILGYRDLDEFLADNSGCMEAMLEWVGDHAVAKWIKSMEEELESAKP